jgi:secreted Zn-dependent insulinase-like peptidase
VIASEDKEEEGEQSEKETEDNSCIHVYFQIPHEISILPEAHIRGMIDLLENVLYEKFFDDLRTQQQLGYHVSAY